MHKASQPPVEAEFGRVSSRRNNAHLTPLRVVGLCLVAGYLVLGTWHLVPPSLEVSTPQAGIRAGILYIQAPLYFTRLIPNVLEFYGFR